MKLDVGCYEAASARRSQQLPLASADGGAIFVVMSALLFALLMPWRGRKFPNRFKHGYEPLSFDANLSFGEKIARWRTQPVTCCNW